jgi:hypothetical protein
MTTEERMQSPTDAVQARASARENAREAARDAAQAGQQAVSAGAQQGARAEKTSVEVRTTDGGQVFLVTDGEGKTRRIEVGNDGRILAGAPEAGTAVAPVPPPASSKQLPEGLVDMMVIIFSSVTLMSLGTPLVKAWARRFEKRQDATEQALVAQRLAAIEQAIETVAVEVERISEGQRFTTKLLAERAPEEPERSR